MGPRIELEEYKARRARLLAEMADNSLAIVMGAKEQVRSLDTNYRFRQESNFFYLTGFNEPESALVLIKGKSEKSIIFTRKSDPKEEQWEGKRLGVEKAASTLGFDEAYDISLLFAKVKELIANRAVAYFPFSQSGQMGAELFSVMQQLVGKERQGIRPPTGLKNLDEPLNEMRLFKSEAELSCLRYVISRSALAHQKAMQAVKNLDYEFQLEGLMQAELCKVGCQSMAYDPIVASGENACILHYTENNDPLPKSGLVLIDAGGEYLNYAADITRTFPVTGKFSKEEKAIYQLVLKAQKAGIKAVAPGVAWTKVQELMLEILVEGLCDLGLLTGEPETLIKDKAYLPFYMHGSGHWLGLDVHDVGAYKQKDEWRVFEPGMVLTVEPGIYILPSLEVPDCYKGIGVRIEDDILVTEHGCEILSQDICKEVDEIESLINGG